MTCRLLTKLKTARKLPRLFTNSTRLNSSCSNPIDWNTHEEFFKFTKGIWVSNEKHEMKMRHVTFDMNELAKPAAKSVGATKCVHVEKMGEGMYSKAFLFTMDDDSQVVGEIPSSNAGLPHFTTASEVATMDFARNALQTPAPKVLAWSSRAEQNTVGAEYIIMEKARGVQLGMLWDEMNLEAKLRFVKSIGEIHNRWASTSFSQYGSLYYSSDLDQPKKCVLTKREGTEVEDSRYAVGPSTGRGQTDDGRIDIDFDRGPWDTVEQYRRAVGYREIRCIENVHELPRSLQGLYGPGTYIRCRTKKLEAVKCYLKLLKYLLPTDPSICSSFLWHSDLHEENIFVNPEQPWEIMSIIDWQSSELLPLFDHAQRPFFLDYEGPPLEGLKRPELPANFDQLSPAEKQEASYSYHIMTICCYYQNHIYRYTRHLHEANKIRETSSFMMMYAQEILVDGEALYRYLTQQLAEDWSDLPGVQAAGNPPFPINYSADDLKLLDKDAKDTSRGMDLMADLQASLGDLYPDHGLVSHDTYNEVKRLLREGKERIIRQLGCSKEERRAWVPISSLTLIISSISNPSTSFQDACLPS